MDERLRKLVAPVARRILHASLQPVGPLRALYRGLYYGQMMGNEAYAWAWRTWVATPMLLSICDKYGTRISADRIPYVTGRCRFELGSNIMIAGKINLHVAHGPLPLLRVGNGVFMGHNVSFALASRIEIGNYVAIGGGTSIFDTEGHNRYAGENKPAWETGPSPEDVAPVVIEDGVWIGGNAAILKGVRVGKGAIIGHGAVVRSNVPAGSLVAGNPARAIPIKLYRADAAQSASTAG